MTKRTLFIGDVHGCYDELMELVNHIGLTPDDHLYFVGDLINKWPKSLEVVEWVRSRPNTFSVIGNHEYFPLVTLDECEIFLSEWSDMSEWRKNWICTQYEKSAEIRELLDSHGHRDWLLALPHIIERDEYILVHGGLHPEHGLDTPREISTLIRLVDGRPWYESYTGTKPIIYGHWAAEWLRIRSNTIGIDTGCCFGGALTAYCLESGEIWQVRAHRVYVEPAHWKGKGVE
jgi:diadenosine tetraphosphatase ApaH/serine/threonine PP2A family protein phosphatase